MKNDSRYGLVGGLNEGTRRAATGRHACRRRGGAGTPGRREGIKTWPVGPGRPRPAEALGPGQSAQTITVPNLFQFAKAPRGVVAAAAASSSRPPRTQPEMASLRSRKAPSTAEHCQDAEARRALPRPTNSQAGRQPGNMTDRPSAGPGGDPGAFGAVAGEATSDRRVHS